MSLNKTDMWLLAVYGNILDSTKWAGLTRLVTSSPVNLEMVQVINQRQAGIIIWPGAGVSPDIFRYVLIYVCVCDVKWSSLPASN